MDEITRVGRYGRFGGRFVTEALWTPLQRLADTFDAAVADEAFLTENERWLDRRVGRPTPLAPLQRISEAYGGGQLLIKREDLCQGGSFCITAAIGQALIARRMGCKRLVAETATGDFGVALGSVGAALGLETRVYVGREDHEAEPMNMRRMRELGVDLEIVDSSHRGRKAACAEALRYWSARAHDTMYCASSAAMPDPYPRMLGWFYSVIGAEAAVQLRRMGHAPGCVIAPVGSGSFAAGLFSEFVDRPSVQLVGVQAGGERAYQRSTASLVDGRPGAYQGTFSYLLQDSEGQIMNPHSIAGGLAVPVAAPQHARWADERAVVYTEIDDEEAVAAVREVARLEGLLLSLETGHALAYALDLLPNMAADECVLVGVTGSGLRDLERLEERESGGAA